MGNANMVSGVFAFENKPAIRYRRILPAATAPARPGLANDVGFADLLHDWIMNGKGEAFVCFSKINKANLRELQPYRVDTNTFFFFNGRYGTGDMWAAVRDARNRGRDIPQVIHDAFCEVGTYTTKNNRNARRKEIKKYIGSLDEWMNSDAEERFPFANKVIYETPEELALPRPYRIWVWEDGNTYYDEYFKSGYQTGIGQIYLEHTPVCYLPDGDEDLPRWRM
jgi:hypothetical protein|tara:strand:- start:7736 stop:8407 length:672 start_codon:yes stop_codon:yes gene_type:complete